MNQDGQQKMVSISAMLTPAQREWLDAEVLRRSRPGDMATIGSVIRSLIDEARGVAPAPVRGQE